MPGAGCVWLLTFSEPSTVKSEPLLVGLDLGTTNVKAVVTTYGGQLLAESSVPVRLFHLDAGGVEQDLAEITDAAFEAIRRAASQVEAARIEAIGVSSQGGAMQCFDGNGTPVGRVISWLDGRGAPYDAALTAELGRAWFVEHIARGRSGLAIGQLLRLRSEGPVSLHEPLRIGFVGDSVVARLSGRRAHDGTSHALTLLYNPSRRTSDPELLARLGIGEHQLPALLSPRQPAGGLLDDVARQTGLTAGIPVAAAIHDQYAAALGGGAVHGGDVMLGAGTAWVLLPVSDHLPPPVIDEAFVCHHVVPGLFGQILSLVNGGSTVAWTQQLLGMEHLSTKDFDRMLASVSPGCDGLLFCPLLAPGGGAGLPPATRGRLTGLQLAHGPAHVLRAVVEGLACELARYLEFLVDAGVTLDRLILCGKAASSQVTPQILADVTGLPVACSSHAETSALGAAILARGLLEPHTPLDHLAESMVAALRTVSPSEDTGEYRRIRDQYRESLSSRPSL
jgi:xylulokinase